MLFFYDVFLLNKNMLMKGRHHPENAGAQRGHHEEGRQERRRPLPTGPLHFWFHFPPDLFLYVS